MSVQHLKIELPIQTQEHELVAKATIKQKIRDEAKHVEQIVLTHQQLVQIKKNCEQLIDEMAKNPSFVSSAGAFWGKIPLWQKIVAGATLTIPILLIGVFVPITALIIVSILMLIVYVSNSLILDNHHTQSISNTGRLKESIMGMADMLGTLIQSLGLMSKQLAESIEKLHCDNEKLTEQINELTEDVETLTQQTLGLTAIMESLNARKDDLVQLVLSLKGSVNAHTELLEMCEEELKQVRLDYQHNQKQLSEKIVELNDVKVSMSLEVKRLKSTSDILSGTVQTLSQSVIGDKERRIDFQKRLNDFLANQEESFDKADARICIAERELALVTEQLNESNRKYKALLDRQEELLQRLTRLAELPLTIDDQIQNGIVKPSIAGFYAKKGAAMIYGPEEQLHPSMMAG